MQAAMDVGIIALVEVRERVDHHLRFLGRRGVVEVGERVEAEISRAEVDVVDIAEDAAAGPPGDFGQKFRLRDG